MKSFFSQENLHWQIAAGLVLACFFGLIFDEESSLAGVLVVDVLGFIGALFVNALKMVVVPLILAAVIVGVANMAGQDAFGRVGAKTIGLYVLTGVIAIFTGLIFVNVMQPGATDNAANLVEQVGDASTVLASIEGRSTADLIDIIARAIPANIFVAASETNLLALIFVGVLVGTFMARLEGDVADTMHRFWTGVYDIMIMIILLVMRFAPLGVLALVGNVFIKTGFDVIGTLAWYGLTVLLALAVHFFLWLPLLLWWLGGINPYAYYGKVVRAQLTAFSTASSSATLPVTINSARRAGISEKSTSFVLPLGATVNMDGTALYECIVVIFIAQLYAHTQGVDFTFIQQITVVVLALLTSIGVAGIPAASLVAIALILTAVGLPVEWIGIVLAVDRILDMCRTATNVTSDLTITAVIASTEGEELEEVRLKQA